MIFLIVAAAVCMGGIVAYLAREKGRSPLVWAVYGTVAAPVALPHILIVSPRDDEDDDVWAEIRNAIQTQSVNDQRPIMARSGSGPAPDPQTAHRRAAPLRQSPAPSVTRPVAATDFGPAPADRAGLTRDLRGELRADLNPAPKPDIKPEPRYEPRYEPNHDMPADKRTPPHGNRAEPSFGPAAPAHSSGRKAANDFILDSSDRIGAPHKQQRAPASEIDMRMRAPLSVDPDAERSERRPIAGKLFAFGAVAVAIGAGFFVLGPTLARLVPPELAFWSQPAVKEVKNTAPALTPFDAQPNAQSAAAPNVAKDALPGGTSGGEARDVGTAKFGGPIKSDPKAPAYQGSGDKPVDLGAATRGMKPVEVPEEPKSETKSEPKSAPKAEPPKTVAATPAPKAEPKAAAVTPAPKVEAPKKAEAPKPAAPAPQASAKPAPQEDFLSMVNKAISTGSTPKPAANTTEAERIEQVGAANDLVQSVQVKLRERGFDPGSIDGRTNPKTVQAIRDYQQSVGMTPDGLIDVALMERLGVVGKRLQFPGGGR